MTGSTLLSGLLGAFFGTIGFAWLCRVPRRAMMPSGLIAVVVYAIYWLMPMNGISEYLAVFCGSLFGSIAGHICARKMRVINTAFLMSAIVPVVPGLGLYRMMASLGRGETGRGAEQGVQAMIIIAMIALGLVMGGYLDRLIHEKRQNGNAEKEKVAAEPGIGYNHGSEKRF